MLGAGVIRIYHGIRFLPHRDFSITPLQSSKLSAHRAIKIPQGLIGLLGDVTRTEMHIGVDLIRQLSVGCDLGFSHTIRTERSPCA